MRLPNVKKGDVFSLNLAKGAGLIQCVKEARETEMETIRVLSGVFSVDNTILIGDIVLCKESFFAMMPLKYAIKKKMIKPLGNFPIPRGSEAPRYFRTKHIMKSEFLGWHIVDSETLFNRLVRELSSKEKQLSPWGMISIPDIIERIENNWTPAEWE